MPPPPSTHTHLTYHRVAPSAPHAPPTWAIIRQRQVGLQELVVDVGHDDDKAVASHHEGGPLDRAGDLVQQEQRNEWPAIMRAGHLIGPVI